MPSATTVSHPAAHAGGATGRRWTLFPRGVRLWHFIVLPSLAMALLLAAFRAVDWLIVESGGSPAAGWYQTARPMAISLMMAGMIAYLALRHRREYEAKLNVRQQALEQARDFLSNIIQGSGEAIVTRDADGRVTSWNRAAERIYGWSADEILGSDIERLMPSDEESRRELQRTEAVVRSGETLRDYETTRMHKHGHRVVVRVTRSPLYDADGKYLGSTGIVRDVTRLKEMEARLLERECLAAVGQMAAQVAHEIKNPLTGIRGACEILAEGFDRGHSRREIAEEVIRQMDRLNRTVEEFLLFARPQAARPAPSNVHLLLDRVVSVLAEDPVSQGVSVERDYDESMPVLDIDTAQMEQVFFNILLNAYQAMAEQGTVKITTRANDGHAIIGIRDTGPGIPDDVARNMFKPFFTTRAQGTGLGLAIVRTIVGNHHGSVRAENVDVGGVEISITLPLEGSPS
jgi:PAS domain S-box-containing protein